MMKVKYCLNNLNICIFYFVMQIRYSIILVVFLSCSVFSQPIAFDFLLINSNAQSAGFGEIGVVSTSNYNAVSSIQNPAIVSQNAQNAGANFTYKSFYGDIHNYGAESFFSIDSNNTFGLIFNHLDYGIIPFASIDNPEGESSYHPKAFYTGIYYSHTFFNKLSVGIKFKYARTNFLEKVGGISFDLGVSYMNFYELSPGTGIYINIGTSILNMGPKVSYPGDSIFLDTAYFYYPDRDIFQPAELNAGVILGFRSIDGNNNEFDFDIGYQFAKLLVSPDSDDPVPVSYINSFKDLSYYYYLKPKHRIGIESRYNIKLKVLIALRAGYSFPLKDNGKVRVPRYLTYGARLGILGFYVDYAKLDYQSLHNFDRWLLNFGFIYNFSKPFRFVD